MNIYILLLILTIIITTGNSVITFRRRHLVGAKTMFFLMLAISIYAFAYIFEILSKSLDHKIIWYNIEYFGIAMLPFLWFLFAFQYSDYNLFFLENKKLFILIAIPVITIIMIWTNKYHGLMIHDIGIATGGVVPELTKINGPWYWVNISYSFLLTITGSTILIRSIFNLPSFYKKQGFILVIGALIPIAGSFLYIFKLTPIESFDFTTVSCAVAGIFLTYSLFKLKVFQIVPIARDRIFDNIDDGVMVIDTEGKILDANKSLQGLLGFKIEKTIGNFAETFFKDKLNINLSNSVFPEEPVMDSSKEKTQFLSNEPFKKIKSEIILETILSNTGNSYDKQYFSVSKIPVSIKNHEPSGYILVFHDITEDRATEKILSESKRKIENINKVAYELSICEEESEVCQKTAFTANEIMGFKFCSFFILNGGRLENKYNSDSLIEKILKNKHFYNELVFNSYESKEASVIEISDHPEILKIINQRSLNISIILSIPIIDMGIVFFFVSGRSTINDENIRICELLLKHSAEALKRLWLQKSLREQAELDPLTGVHNRRYFNHLIKKEEERSKRYNYPITLIMVDIDRFKEINDKYGHQIGDNILKGIGLILEGQTRKVDTVIRYGGDEFLILLPEVSDKNVNGFINRLKEAVLKWNSETRLVDFIIELSIGVSCWEPDLNEPIEKILHLADMDMYADKKKKRN